MPNSVRLVEMDEKEVRFLFLQVGNGRFRGGAVGRTIHILIHRFFGNR